jgi:hypothetical protein
MIVMSSSLVLAEVDEGPPGCPWIGYHQLATSSNVDSTTEDSSHPVTNIANPATHLYWMGGANTASDEYVSVSGITYGDDIDYLAIAAHNLGTGGFMVSVEGKIDVAPDSPDQPYVTLIDEMILPDDSPTIFRFEPQPLTHIRLRIQGGTETPRIGSMYVGKLLVPQRSITVESDHVPMKYGRRSIVVNGMSETGNFLGRTLLQEWRESEARFEHFEPDWWRTYMDPFLQFARTKPFFFAWHPETYPLEASYAWLTNNPDAVTSTITQRVHTTLAMRGIA